LLHMYDCHFVSTFLVLFTFFVLSMSAAFCVSLAFCAP